MEVPRRLEREMAGAALEAVLSSRAASISDSSVLDEANEESLMIKLLQAWLVRLAAVLLLLLGVGSKTKPSLCCHPPSLHVANKYGKPLNEMDRTLTDTVGLTLDTTRTQN